MLGALLREMGGGGLQVNKSMVKLEELLVRESLVTEDRTKLDTKWRADTKIFQEIDFI